ncbi:MAG TPA: phasin family protein [Gammaproteobacteria bacterium]|nr:phasin family protein [Gammaproteobacteria bacterium]
MSALSNANSFQKLFEPNRHVAQAMIGTTEKLAHFQIDCAHRYASYMLDEMRAMLDVHDGESLKSFVGHQRDVARDMGSAVSEDLKRLSELGRGFTEEMEKASRESREALSEAAETEPRKSA